MKPPQFVVEMNGSLYGLFGSQEEATEWGNFRASCFEWAVEWSVRQVGYPE